MTIPTDRFMGFSTTQKRSLQVLFDENAAGTVDTTALATGAVTSAKIADGTIVNADINASAAIALSKLANVAAGTDGLSAGTLQATLQALATRIQVLEDAA